MIPAVSTHLFVYSRLAETHLAMVADAGFNTIELWGSLPHFNYHDKASIRAMENLLTKYDIVVDSVHCALYTGLKDFKVSDWLNLGSTDEENRSRAVSENAALIDAVSNFGARVLVLHHDTTRSGVACQAPFTQSLKELVETAAPAGITLTVENLTHDFSVFANLKEFIEPYKDNEVALTLDVGHARLNSSISAEIATGGDRIISLHVHDNEGNSDAHMLPGDGNTDWPAVHRDLLEISFDGPFMQELRDPDRESGDEKRFAEVLGRARLMHDRILS